MNHDDSRKTEPRRPDGGGGFWNSTLSTICLLLLGGAMLLLMWRGQSLASGAWLLLPLALCLGMHFLMHRHHERRGDE